MIVIGLLLFPYWFLNRGVCAYTRRLSADNRNLLLEDLVLQLLQLLKLS